MSRNKQNHRPNFFRSHADTIAIMAVNVAIAAILISLWISSSHRLDAMNSRIDAANSRSDQLHCEFYDLLKETKK